MLNLIRIFQVREDPIESCVSLLREYRVKLFRKEISDLLMQQSNSSVFLSNFMASYVKHFGQKFKLSSFGFTRLTDLIKAVSDVAEVSAYRNFLAILSRSIIMYIFNMTVYIMVGDQ